MSSRILGQGGTPGEALPVLWRSVDGLANAQGYLPAAQGPASCTSAPYALAPYALGHPGQESRLQAAYQQGMAAGEATAAQQAGALAAPVLQNFGAIVRELSAARATARREAEESMVRLAIAIARRVLQREVATDPLAILGLVRAGLDRLNARELHRLLLSPGDAQVARDNRDDLHLPPAVEIAADPALPPGSALFETARGELDASVTTQLDEIERGFADLAVRRRSEIRGA